MFVASIWMKRILAKAISAEGEEDKSKSVHETYLDKNWAQSL